MNALRPGVSLVALLMVGCHARSDRAPEPARAAALTATEAPPAAASVGSARGPAREKPGAPFTGIAGLVDVPRSPKRYRVLELSAPPRFVVDFRH